LELELARYDEADGNNMVTEEEVVWAYRLLLGREPENAAVIASNLLVPTREDLRSAIFKSPEFLAQAEANRFPDKWVITGVMGGTRQMWVNLSDRHVSLGCLFDDYEPYETGIFRKLLTKDTAFFDIGANVGWYSVVASTIIDESGNIDSFEPRPETANYLRKTFALNNFGQRSIIHQLGVAEHSGSATLEWQTGTDNPGGSHLGTGVARAGTEGARIELITIDSLKAERCDVIKIDVEGAEYRAMVGATDLLQRTRPSVLSELHPGQLQGVSGVSPADYIMFMAELGYECRLVQAGMPMDEIKDFPTGIDRSVTNVLFLHSTNKDRLLPLLID
jgi:FkbM family methyltransferase